MLVECPRCHFRQPQDQYCANCGVDMLAYKPKEDPFLIKIAKSGMFQFLMVVLLGIGVTTFVVRTDQPQQWIQKINRFASVSPNTSPEAKTEAGIAEDQAEFEAPPPQVNTWAARAASPATEAANTNEGVATTMAATAAPRAGTGDVSPTQTVSTTAKVRVQMVEIDHDYLNSLMNERNGGGSPVSGDVIVFRLFSNVPINSVNYRLLKADNLDFTGVKNNSISAGNNVRWIRFTMSAILLDADTKNFNTVFMKNHPNDVQQLPIDMTFGSGQKYIVSGRDLLSYFESDSDVANTPPFTIFKSVDYRNQKTTFAIIVELQ